MTTVAAIMPCRGRPEQTVACVRRLLSTAGAPLELIAVGSGGDFDPLMALQRDVKDVQLRVIADNEAKRLTYWQALAYATERTDAQLLVNLANDLLPGQHWLKRAIEAYQEQWPRPNDYGLLGFNGDSHEVGHSCHFMIDRDFLTYLGGWPTHYDHAFGDTELCQKAIALGFYAKAPWALLYHDHPYWGGQDDAVYAEGRAAVSRDEQLYLERKRMGWPTVPQTH